MYGTHTARCMTCGHSFETGDCIPPECPACERARLSSSIAAQAPYCTLIGVADTTDFDALWTLSRAYPWVEWGVLFSQERQGNGRSPSWARLGTLVDRMCGCEPPNFALHVRGRTVLDLLADTGTVTLFARWFPRIQVSLPGRPDDLSSLREWLGQESRRTRGRAHRTLITKHDNGNPSLWRSLSDYPNHAVLFSGRFPERCWPAPLSITQERLPFAAKDPQCGYEVALGLDALADQMPQIHAAASGRPYWIAMENVLRDEQDRFDLDKAKRYLEIVHRFRDG